ncbi:MAG: amidohydrolase [Propionibacteriaceae bacterium]|nr:amidohydrolase [Propionibacteriaceae bacterium]
MIIDSHAHLVAPDALYAFRTMLLANGGFRLSPLKIPDDQLEVAAANNVAIMDSVGTDVQVISPRPFQLASSMQPTRLVDIWVKANNDAIAQTISHYPRRFAGMAGLPLTPDAPVSVAFSEIDRVVSMGFIGVLLNPDLTEGRGLTPSLGSDYWYPLWEKLIDADLPILIHSSGCFSERETYSEHFITEESIAILSMLREGVFDRYPGLRVMVSHGGGSVPYQMGRWQAEYLDPHLGGNPDAEPFESQLRKFYFDTVLHYPLALELLFRTVGSDRILFGTEKPGSGSGTNPKTGKAFDELRPVIEGFDFLTQADRDAVFLNNAKKFFPRLAATGVLA